MKEKATKITYAEAASKNDFTHTSHTCTITHQTNTHKQISPNQQPCIIFTTKIVGTLQYNKISVKT